MIDGFTAEFQAARLGQQCAEKGQKPLACARGSELRCLIFSDLPSCDCEGAELPAALAPGGKVVAQVFDSRRNPSGAVQRAPLSATR
jgi:hypothetical protein